MSDVVIRVEEISKRYRLGLIGRTALHEDLSRWWARLHGRPDPTLRLDQLQKLEARKAEASELQDDAEHIWALRDINFEVKQGEVLGIIGKNGAGKSTLLKILSRVTAPTLGCIKVKGRIASLLEVGTGFHPELTGRENIFLNGAILGMSKAEVRCKMDEIVAFAELHRFIDTPVKRYSSGMYVRLAFAVAAHLDPEILVVDEVLAVGDVAFQKKCLGKMGDVAKGGRTVLFVSHNMASIKALCTSGVWLSGGQLRRPPGPVGDVVAAYMQQGGQFRGAVTIEPSSRRVISPFRIETVEILLNGKSGEAELSYGQPLELRLGFVTEETIPKTRVGLELVHGGLGLCSFLTPPFTAEQGGRRHVTCIVPGFVLCPGVYDVHVGASVYQQNRALDWVQDVLRFNISAVAHDDARPYDRSETGIVRLPYRWEGVSASEEGMTTA